MSLGPPRPDLTDAEQRAHFSLWAMLAAPLLAGNDVRSMSDATREILTNRDVIAVDQDPLVVAGRAMRGDPQGDRQAAHRRFGGGGPVQPRCRAGRDPDRRAASIGLAKAACYSVRDLWQHSDTTTNGVVGQTVPAHGVVMLRVTPNCP